MRLSAGLRNFAMPKSETNSHHETFSKFLAVLGLSKILAILEGSEQIFPRKRLLGAPDSRFIEFADRLI